MIAFSKKFIAWLNRKIEETVTKGVGLGQAVDDQGKVNFYCLDCGHEVKDEKDVIDQYCPHCKQFKTGI